MLSSPYSSKDQNKPTWITIHLTSTRRFAGVLFYCLQYMHMYTTSIYTLHICHCVFFIHFRGGTFRQNQVLRALLDAYPAAAEEKHPQVEVMGFFLFVFFFWGCFFVLIFVSVCWRDVSFREFHTLKTLNQTFFFERIEHWSFHPGCLGSGIKKLPSYDGNQKKLLRRILSLAKGSIGMSKTGGFWNNKTRHFSGAGQSVNVTW